MRQITPEHLTTLLAVQEPPCISLYLPTHRLHPENQQDSIRYRNLLREAEKILARQFPMREVRVLMEKLEALAFDDGFWNHRTDALAVLGSLDTFQIFELQRTVKTLLVVSDSFHTKPLLRTLQAADRYQVLHLSRHEAKLYEGNRFALDPVELTKAPSTMTEALGTELTEQHLTVASYGAGAARAAGGGAAPSIHAHGDKKDEVDIDRDRFFRAVDRAILEHHSRPTALPLMLATLTEHHAPFREMSHNPFLMADGIMMNSDALSLDQLRAQAWQIMERIYMQRLLKLAENYRTAWSRRLASDDLAEVARAATAGRVGTLLVEENRQIPGKIDPATGQVQLHGFAEAQVDDVLDDLAETVLRMKGEVVVVSAEQMPSTTGLAASYRF